MTWLRRDGQRHCGSRRWPQRRVSRVRKHGAASSTPPAGGAFRRTWPPQNLATAVKWWRKAAQAGDVAAQWYIGLCYYYGRGMGRDAAQAMACFRKSAAQGVPPAVQSVQLGIPGQGHRDAIARFTLPPIHHLSSMHPSQSKSRSQSLYSNLRPSPNHR
jgi:hypothetical protein